MLRKRFAALVLGTALLAAILVTPHLMATDIAREEAVVEFTRPTVLGEALLKGTYRIIHDDDKAAKGEPCLLVYREAELDEGEVAAVHCVRKLRDRSGRLKVWTERITVGMDKVKEIQFAGFAYGHQTY